MTKARLALPPPDDASQLDLNRLVLALLAFISNRMTSSGSAQYRRGFGIGIMEFRIMVMLDLEPGASGARIADVIGLDRSAVSRSIRAMETRGIVSVSPGRGHVFGTRLTEMGQELYDAAKKVCLEREQRLLSGLTPDERETLRALLPKLLAATDHVAALTGELEEVHQGRAAATGL